MFLPDALEALIALGELDRAAALITLFERRARELDRGWALATSGRCRALLLAARGDLSAAATALDRTLEQHATIDFPFERARTLLVQGTVERRRRRRNRAAQVLGEALAQFERMDAKSWAKRVRAELDRIDGGTRGSANGLSPSERRVGELAAEGLSNKEIAAALFVSVHTIEVHLSRVYAKLGVHSRTRLAGRLADTK
jgi:ATP/maltotriose-dependent transcriptional regulator MalT